MNRNRAQWIALLAAAVGMFVGGQSLVGQEARLVDVVALAGASVLFGVTLVGCVRSLRERSR